MAAQSAEDQPPPPGLTEQAKEALEQAREGNAQPADRPRVKESAPSKSFANGDENPSPSAAPTLGTTFQGSGDTGRVPDTQIAAGPNNVVVATNNVVNIFDKRGNALDVWRVTNAAECCDNDASLPALSHSSRSVGSYVPSGGARQQGTSTRIDAGPAWLLNAIWRDGKLTTGQTIACGSGGADTCAGYNELDVSNFPSISTVNNFAYGASGFDFFYPAVASNSDDDKAMVLNRSSSSQYVSARYVGISSSSTCSGTGCINGEVTLQNGGNYYVRFDGDLTDNVKKQGAATSVAATVTYDPATKKATLNPGANLQPGATYVASVKSGARDLAGNRLDQDPNASGNQATTWKFTVKP